METTDRRKTGTARLWQLTSYKKGLVISACVLAVVSVGLSFVPYVSIYYIVRELLASFGGAALDTAYLIRQGWVACGSAIASLLVYFGALMCSHLAAFKTLYYLKLKFTRHIASLPLGFHTQNSTGKLRKVVDDNIEKLESFIAHQLPDIVGSFATPVFALVILFAFDWRLGLAALVGILSCYILQMVAYSGNEQKKFMKRYADSLEEMNNASVEYVRGISVVKAFNQTIFSFRKFHDIIRDYTKFVYSYTKSFETPMAWFMLLVNNIYLFVLPIGILIIGGAADYSAAVLSLIFYLIFSMACSGPFLKLMYVSSGMTQVADSVYRMDRILDVNPLPETKDPQYPASSEVAFNDVSFTYNGEGEAEAVSYVSFVAKQGEITALVGPSGSGKSTLAHLIPRFYDVVDGSISIGGVDVRDMAHETLMDQVSFVFQDVFLFKQSILDNLLIARPGATREQAIEAAKAAQCNEFIERLPDGYDTVIGTKGIHLSGGERQRLVIARAILKDAPIIVLDEATAFADPENEHKIQKAFEKLMKDKTVIIIAHRLSTIRGANNIVVIDEGHVVEQGVHDDLVDKNGRYAQMWRSYVGALGWTITESKEGGESHVAANA